MVKTKYRVDQLLVQKGFVESREQAKRLIMAGQVYWIINEQAMEIVQKPGQLFSSVTQFIVKDLERFVSRGGYKLLTALRHFNIEIKDKIALDVGASTGGFTDCLLQLGARKVYAVDVGYGQLHWKLRNDPRVVNLERVNMRYAPSDLLPEYVDLVVVDCSFISLEKIIPSCVLFLRSNGYMICLIKPQFELSRKETERGIVRLKELQDKAVQKIIDYAQKELGLQNIGVVQSEIKGPKGNQEYLALFSYIPC